MSSFKMKSIAIWFFAFVISLTSHAFAGGGHSIGLFGGAKTAHSSTHLALGVEGEYNVLPLISATAFFEQVFSTPHETALGVGALVRPLPLTGLKLMAIPAIEFAGGEKHIFFRAGVGYDFSILLLHIGPVFNVDVVSGGPAFVYGIALGFGL